MYITGKVENCQPLFSNFFKLIFPTLYIAKIKPNVYGLPLKTMLQYISLYLYLKGVYTMKTVSDRFLTYVKHHTTSDEDSASFPSTKTQLDFAAFLSEECNAIGLKDVAVDQYGYVTATLPGSAKNSPTIAFIAHMDTSPDASGENINPNIM
jgi:hypothetical protein